MAAKKSKPKGKLPAVGIRKINPRGATVLVNLPKGKKKVALYGLV